MQDTTVKTALLGAAVGAGITASWFLAKQEANTGADAQATEVPAATGVKRFISDKLKGASYKPVEILENIAASIGKPVEELVKLNANENIYGAPQSVLDELDKSGQGHFIYPDPTQMKLRTALADLHKEHGVKLENVVAGAGSDDILDIIMRLVSPEVVVISTPTFGMYTFLGKISGIKVIEVKRNSDFTVDVDAIVAAVRKHKAKLVFLPSPNNPTGTILPNAVAETILQEDTILVSDEAYADFCDVTALDLFQKYDNLIVCRTFSKWAGLAGLRLGYGIAHADLISVMMGIKQPYNVNTAAEIAGLAALKHRDEILVTVNALRAEKDRMWTRINEELSWLKPVPSDANFVLNEVVGGLVAEDVYQSLRASGVIIRYFGKQGGDLSNYIRISAGKPEDTDRVLSTLADIGSKFFKLTPEATKAGKEAVILDMDGVLADVTNSQHTAIIETAKLYGVTVTEDDIGRVKAAGNANNDWIITVALINETGHQPPATLEKVTEQWEEMYQGTPGKPGLWEVETLLMCPHLLRRISKALPVAVVTGRPRSDAQRFLEQHNIQDCVQFMVCHGEKPSKPSPDGVIAAMEHLKVKNCIFVGDTPDDIHAAVAAGVVGLGVCAPASEDAETTKVLMDCGANQVLSEGLHELAALLQ